MSRILGLLSLGAPVRRGRLRAAYLLRDTFTGTNGSMLNAHAPDVGSGPWVHQSGTFDLQNNRANHASNGGTGDARATLDAGRADVRAELTVNLAATASAGILARFVDNQNFWMLILNLGTGDLQLWETTAGTSTLRASSAFSGSISTDYQLRLVCQGNQFTGTVNGGNTVAYSSANHNSATKFGLRSIGIGNDFDDFAVLPA
jgi:hypothetical protein